MKKLIYLIIAITILGLIVVGCIPVVPPAQQDELGSRTNGSTLYVDDDNCPGPGSGTLDDPFCTIQAAIDDAVNGDTILVANGNYTITSKILVDKGVIITGNIANPENVVVQYSPTANSLIFDMLASNATIQGIKTTGGKTGFWFDQSSVTGCTVSHCIVDTVNEYGIYMKNGGSGHTIDLCTISNTGQTYAGAPAVLIENCLGVTFSNNTLSSISDKGVYVRVCNAISIADRVEVTGNTISGCAYPCIQVYQSPYTYVYNNTISSTGDKGINIIGPNATSRAARVIVEGNTISGCPWSAILVTHDRYTYIYNNTISSCDDKGICIADGENVGSSAQRIVVEGNTVSGTEWPGIQVYSNIDYTYIHNNIIFNTTREGIQTLASATILGNEISGCWHGIQIRNHTTGTVIKWNNIHDNTYHGIEIPNCGGSEPDVTGVSITNNTFTNNGYTGINVGGGTDGSGININYNGFEGNVYFGVESKIEVDDPSSYVDATHNWWGHASGPGGEGGRKNKVGKIIGKGDAVSYYVNWDPWLSQPTVPPTQILNKWDIEGTFVAHPTYNWGGLAEGATWGYSIHIKEAMNGDFSVGSIYFTTGDIEVTGIVEQTKSDYAYWAGSNLAAAGRAEYNDVTYNFLFLYSERSIWFTISQADLEPSWSQDTVWPGSLREYQLHSKVPDETFIMDPKNIH